MKCLLCGYVIRTKHRDEAECKNVIIGAAYRVNDHLRKMTADILKEPKPSDNGSIFQDSRNNVIGK